VPGLPFLSFLPGKAALAGAIAIEMTKKASPAPSGENGKPGTLPLLELPALYTSKEIHR
jgi:hypothetical protein